MTCKEYKTVRYMKRKDLNLSDVNSSQSLRNRLNSVDSDKDLVVRLRVNSPVYVEEALELTPENIRIITS